MTESKKVHYGYGAKERNATLNGESYPDIAAFVPGVMSPNNSQKWRIDCEIDAGRLMWNVRR